MKLTVIMIQCEKGSGFLNGSWCRVKSNHVPSVTVVSVVDWWGVFVDKKNKQKNKPKLAKECSRQGGKIKTWSVEMFLKWRHLSPILHYAANVIERVRSGKFKALFYGKKHRTKFFGLNTCLDVIEMPKPQKPCWSYGHFNDRGEWGEVWYLFINF